MYIVKYVERINKLTSSESYLVDFINNNPHFFVTNKISDISKQANVSNSTITRLYKKLDFKSLKAFQIMIAKKITNLEPSLIQTNDLSISAVMNNLRVYHTYSIYETLSDVQQIVISQLVDKICQTKKIQLFGLGSSWTACNELGMNLEKIGFDVMTNHDFHMQLLNLTKLTTDDLMIVVSKTMTAKEINFLVEKCLEFKIPLCVLTSNKQYHYKTKINFFISFAVFEQEKRITAISSKISQLVLADLIFTAVYHNLHGSNSSLIERGNNIIDEWNKK
ncbi:MurR/RpiR family transcriptional regulator [Spiroplasma clarkii]|uniref:MurR/RpiR family transcriptional regulator n=1 Tax=Spiroplasma clarkii TaxID=2139 RepID=A0A2K8KND6_9MOLU|nr:MurR/RpiR family transcriptional regulator [Spiroplasma clarkii]ATX71254.1 MurR/RpiR family transcriptional regulator [Spiroplasma clarkii]